MSDHEVNIEERLNRHPILKSRVESLLNIAENSSEITEKADDAEFRLIDELRRMGNEILQDWALEKESVTVGELRNDNENIIGHGKKNFIGTQRSAQ